MKRFFVLLALMLLPVVAVAQQDSHTAYRFRTASSAPATCSPGDVYYNTTSNTSFDCTAMNTWTAIGGAGGGVTGSVSSPFIPFADATNDLQNSAWEYGATSAKSLQCSGGLSGTCEIDILGGSLSFYESQLSSTDLCFNEGTGGSPICVQGNNDFSLGLGPDAKVDLSGNLTVTSCTGCGSGSPGSPSASPQANNAGAFAGVPFELFSQYSPGQSGSGTEGSPWANSADNNGGIGTALGNLTVRGGLIDLPAGRFNISSPISVGNSSPLAWRFKGNVWGIANGSDSQLQGISGTTLHQSNTTGNIFAITGSGNSLYNWTDIEQLGFWGATPATQTEANACIDLSGKSGLGLDHVLLSNCGVGLYVSGFMDSSFITRGNFSENGVGIQFSTNNFFNNTIINNVIGDNDGWNLNASGTSTGGIFSNNQQARGCRLSACSTNPANMVWGYPNSVLVGNVSSDPGYCPSFDPTNCGAGSTHAADNWVFTAAQDLIVANLFDNTNSNSGANCIHLETGTAGAIVGLNVFHSCQTDDIKIDSGVTDTYVEGPFGTISDSGTRTVLNKYSTNIGNPNSAGNWNGHTKYPGLHIYDATNSNFYEYLPGNILNQPCGITPSSGGLNFTIGCTYANGSLANGELALWGGSPNFTLQGSPNVTYASGVLTLAGGTTHTPFEITTSDTTGDNTFDVALGTSSSLGVVGFVDDAGQGSGIGVGGTALGSGAFGAKSLFIFGNISPGYGVNYVTRNPTGNHNFYCNSTSVTCLVGAANGNWEFKNQLTVDSFASASTTPVCSNSGTLATCTGISSVLTGTTGSIGGSALLAGQCAAGTVTVTGATSAMVATASPSSDPDSNLSTGVGIYAFVSGSNTVTVRVCAIVAVTPAATTYNVRVLQ